MSDVVLRPLTDRDEAAAWAARSATVIERCGGVLENVVTDEAGAPKRRYWVPTS